MIDVPPIFALSSEHRAGGSWIVRVVGELDLYTSPRLENELEALVRSGATEITVDVTDVPFLDSSGLAVLLGAAGRLEEGRLRLAGLGIEARRVLEITGADRLLPIVQGAAGAVTA